MKRGNKGAYKQGEIFKPILGGLQSATTIVDDFSRLSNSALELICFVFDIWFKQRVIYKGRTLRYSSIQYPFGSWLGVGCRRNSRPNPHPTSLPDDDHALLQYKLIKVPSRYEEPLMKFVCN